MNSCVRRSIFEEWNKNVFSFAEYILLTLNEGLEDGGVQNVSTIFLIFRLIIPRISYPVLITT